MPRANVTPEPRAPASASATVSTSAPPRVGFTCERLTHTFAGTSGEVVAIDGIDLRVRPGEFVCIVGPSGCGKTTLLRIIAGLLEPSGGTIRFDGHAPGEHPRNGLVFQEHGVFPWMTVMDNVAFGLEMRGIPRGERRERAATFIDRIGLGPFRESYPHELSVGMRQRVGIARAFVADVPILLMDEPFGSLDAQTKLVLQEELLRIWRDDQKLIVYVTHDIEEAVHLGDQVLVMTGRPGKIRERIPIATRRPRDLTPGQPEVTAVAHHVWKLLEDEVRRSLSIRE
jgi:NitT/TauT family transport system ATP-binding protein